MIKSVRLLYVFFGGFVAADYYVEAVGGIVDTDTLEVVVDWGDIVVGFDAVDRT